MKIVLFMKKYIFPVVMVILIIVVWNAAEFLKESSGMLPKIMAANLPFRVNPEIFGGDIIASINDGIGDNKMLKLPENDSFKNGYDNTDIINYITHKPTKDGYGKWFWNIDLEFVNLAKVEKEKFDLIKGTIYIDIDDGKKDGSNKTFSDGEKIRFSDDFRWNYMITFDYLHENGTLYSFDTKNKYMVNISYISKIETIRLSIPLVEKLSNKMDKKYMGRHIAAVGFYSPHDGGELLSIAENADRTHTGGGKNYKYLSPYCDFVAKKVDIFETDYIKLTALKISDAVSSDYAENHGKIKVKLTELSKKDYNSPYGEIGNDEIKKAKKLSDEGKYEEAENILSKYLDNSSIANTFFGITEARIAGGENLSVSKKVNYVNSSFKFFDKAESLAKNDNDLYVLLNNRIGVASSVPDEIFGKLAVAEADLKRLLLFNLPIEEKAGNYLKLIDIYEKKNKKRELRLLLSEIQK